jgi:hypothetical protein
MKSRKNLSLTHRAVTLAGLLALASLAQLNAAHAQTVDGERALLNKTDTSFGVSETKAAPVIDGARALLGQPGASAPQAFRSAGSGRATLGDAFRFDGERALLGWSSGPRATRANSALRH